MSNLPYFTRDDIRAALPMPAAIDAMRGAFRALGQGRVTMPVRLPINTLHGVTLFMPAFIDDGGAGQLGQKIVSVYAANRAQGLPVIHALVTVIDAMTGVPTALLDGTYLTALRTGAVSGLATDLLAQPTAHVLTIIGAGGQAACQIEAVCAVRPITTVNIISRGESAAALVSQLAAADPARRYVVANDAREQAIRAADVIVTSTASREPLFDGAWVRDDAHVNAIGAYRHDMREVDAVLLNRADVYVDQRAAALEEAGDLLIPDQAGEWPLSRIAGELSELVLGTLRPDRSRLTFFKSCGLAVEDIAAANAIVKARR
jgi:ornithine cyclodeaminase/alanine dehydrogenase-like protein (mu-crystallin family)